MGAQTKTLKHLGLVAGPQTKKCWVTFTPNGSSAPTVDEAHGVNATVSRSSAGVYVITLAGGVKAVAVEGLNCQTSGTNNHKMVATHSVSAKTVTVTCTNNPTRTVVGPVRIADVSTASSGHGVAPIAGTVSAVYSVLGGAITGADSAVTNNINGTPMTNGTLTVAQSGSAAGDVDTATPTAANTVAAGDKLTATTDGASTGAQTLDVYYVIDTLGVASDTVGKITVTMLVREAS